MRPTPPIMTWSSHWTSRSRGGTEEKTRSTTRFSRGDAYSNRGCVCGCHCKDGCVANVLQDHQEKSAICCMLALVVDTQQSRCFAVPRCIMLDCRECVDHWRTQCSVSSAHDVYIDKSSSLPLSLSLHPSPAAWERPGWFTSTGKNTTVLPYDWKGFYGHNKNENYGYLDLINGERTFGWPGV